MQDNKKKNKFEKKTRGHPGLNQGPLDLQSNALPLSYIPMMDLDDIDAFNITADKKREREKEKTVTVE
jgi:hypothetical protein